jgi:hypothetical protein
MGINVGKTRVMRISREPYPLQIVIAETPGECGIFQAFG